MISVVLADKNYLTRLGLEALLNTTSTFNLVATVGDNFIELEKTIASYKPAILITDFFSLSISSKQIKQLKTKFKKLQILAITDLISKQEIKSALEAGVCSYLLKECDKEEILEALHHTCAGQSFLCGKIAHVITNDEKELTLTKENLKVIACDGVGITDREIEIMKHIADGLSNKQIADKLCLSTHTVNTHRKNIMNKLGVNNTAGIVMFAVKNQLLDPNPLLFS